MLTTAIKKLEDVLAYLDQQNLTLPATYTSMALEILKHKQSTESENIAEQAGLLE